MTTDRRENHLSSAFVDKKTTEILADYGIEKGWLSQPINGKTNLKSTFSSIIKETSHQADQVAIPKKRSLFFSPLLPNAHSARISFVYYMLKLDAGNKLHTIV